MKHIKWVTITVFLFSTISCDRKPDEIIACGDDQVIVIKLSFLKSTFTKSGFVLISSYLFL